MITGAVFAVVFGLVSFAVVRVLPVPQIKHGPTKTLVYQIAAFAALFGLVGIGNLIMAALSHH